MILKTISEAVEMYISRKLIHLVLLFLAVILMAMTLFSSLLQAQENTDKTNLLESLSKNSKLNDSNKLIGAFRDGEKTISVIVSLSRPKQALALTPSSESGAPDRDFNVDLADQNVRSMLQQAVTEKLDQFLTEMDVENQPLTANQTSDKSQSQPMKVIDRFKYVFGFSAQITPQALSNLLKHKDVIRVEENILLKPNGRQGIPLMNASSVRSTYQGKGVSVLVADTGVDTTHPSLDGGKVLGGFDFGSGDSNFQPTGDDAHGTSVAGIVAGDITSVGNYIGGVAPAAKLYAIKISDNTGTATAASLINAWEWAITHKNDDPSHPILVVNTSFGGGRFTSTCNNENSIMTQAALNAVNAGISHFVASGNDGYCNAMQWPACISHVNSVGALYDANVGRPGLCISTLSCLNTTPNTACGIGEGAYFETSTFANRVTAYSNTASNLTLFAPADNAAAPDITGSSGYTSGSYLQNFGGTSAAAPYSAGAAAVLQSAARSIIGRFLTPNEVTDYLVSTGTSTTDNKSGITKPRINLAAAIARLVPATPPRDDEFCFLVGKAVICL